MKRTLGHLIITVSLTLIFSSYFFTGNIFGQTVTLGTGTTLNSTTSYPAPYGNWYWGAKHQFLIRASELSANCALPGNITALGFDVATIQGTPLVNFTIRIKSTAVTVLSSPFDNIGFTTVYGPQIYSETSGWNMHAFSTPFNWDGTSNLLIEVCFDNNSYTYNALTRYTTTSFNSCLYYRADNSTVCANSTASVSANRPNIRLNMPTTVVPIIKPTKNNINYGNVLLTTSKKDSLYIKNNGCGNLNISNITKQTNNYTLSVTSGIVLPRDSMKLVVTFTPPFAGTFNDTLKIFSNAGDSLVRLTGIGVPPPIISFNPTSFNVNINSCNDSITMPLTINNIGLGDLNYNIFSHEINFYDGFESGNFNSWNIGTGFYTRSISNTQFSNGAYSFRITGGNYDYRDGIYHTFPTALANNISYSVMSPVGSTGWNCGVNIGNSADIVANGGIADTWIDNDALTVYLWCNSGTYTIPMVQGQWYKIEYRNINYTTKRFDYYVNGNLVAGNLQFWNNTLTNINVVHLFGYDAGQTSYFDEIYIANSNFSWLSTNPISGTVSPSGSAIVNVKFKSTNLANGTYQANLYLSSNDPVSPFIAVPCNLTVIGEPNINIPLSGPCPAFNTIMVGDADQDTFMVQNLGCDTLFLSNVTTSSGQFVIDTFPAIIPPYSNGQMLISFLPTIVANHTTTITVQNNDLDTSFCLQGISLPAPTISTNPTSFNVFIACGDSLTDTLFIYNSGAANLTWSVSSTISKSDDFDPVIDPTVWFFNNGFTSINCGSVSGNALYFNDAASRRAETIDLNTVGGGNINFYIRLGNGGSCEYLDPGEDVVLEYSNNAGGIWTNITTFYSGTYLIFTPISITIPIAAKTLNTRFRWRQINHSGSCCDHWALDNVSIDAQLTTNVSPSSGTTSPSGSDTVLVEFNSSGLNVGQYINQLTILSNDPANGLLTIPCTVNVVGNPDMQVSLADIISPSCLDLDSIMEFTTSIDTILLTNTGCDTLRIDSLTFSPSVFSLYSGSIKVAPGALGKILVQFAPVLAGNYTGSLNIFTNDIDTVICLKGKVYPRPIINVDPDSLNISLSCNNSLVDTLTIFNTGLNNLIYNIDTVDYSLSLDGNGDYVRRNIPVLPTGGSQVTIEAWIYPQGYSDPTYNGIVSWGNRTCNGNGILLGIQNSGRPTMAGWCNDFTPGSGPTANINQWNHIAMVLNGTSVTLYMNGQSISGTIPYAPIFTSSNLAIGCTDYPGRYFNGRIDDVRIWNIARTQSEIVNNMNQSLTGNEPGLVSYWDFDGKNAIDIAGSNDGTLFGNSTFVKDSPVPVYTLQGNLNDTLAPGNSAEIEVQFTSVGLTVGNYIDSIIINNNDPVNNPLIVPVNLIVYGAPQFNAFLSDSITNCLYLDSIMEFTTSIDTISIYNIGCDTLFIDSLKYTPASIFSTFSAPPYVLPGDTNSLIVQFSPQSVGLFSGSVNIYTNVLNSVVCLQGETFPRPVLSFTPDTFNITITSCQDTVTDQLTIINSGLSDLQWNLLTPSNISDDFDPVINNPIWSFNNGFLSANCGSVSGNALYFNDNGVRQVSTIDINTSGGGSINFYIRLGDGGSCEFLDPGEDVVLEYSNNGGGLWAPISTYYSGNYFTFTSFNIPIPVAAKTTNTRFRWRQLSHSGSCCDHWALDNISISAAGQSSVNIIPTPYFGTTSAGNSSIVNILFTDSGLVGGIYNFSIYINSNDPLNSVDTVIVNLTIDSVPPVAPNANDVSICFGNPTPSLIAVPGNLNDTVNWYNTSLTLIHVGDTLVTGETAVGTYTYYATSLDSATGCESRADTVYLNINSAPAEPTSLDVSSCYGASVPALNSTGTIPLWYSNSSLTNLVYTGNPYNTGITVAGIYTFYVADSTGGCPKSLADTTTLTIFSLPNIPVSTDTSVCVGGPIPLLTATVIGTDSLRWYNSLMVFVGSGSSYNTGQTTAGIYKYYVTSVDSVTGCESLRDSSTLTIYNTAQPISDNASACFGSVIPSLSAIGSSIIWYDATMTVLYTGNPFNTGETIAGTYSYYVTQTLNGCESPPLSVTLTINPIPTVPVAPDMISCFGQTTPALTATGTNIKWYSDALLNTLIASGSPYNTGITAPGTYTYYVTQTAAGCPSLSDTVYLIINPRPVKPIASNQVICFGNPTPDLIATGITGSDTVHWYNNSALTPVIYTGNPYATGQTAIGTYIYYVTQSDTVTGCRSLSDTVSLIINDVPAEPTVNDVTICSGGSAAIMTSTGVLPLWYNNAGLNPVLYSGNSYNTGLNSAGTYTFYVADSVAGCPHSLADTAILTINATPPAPIAGPQSNAICIGDPNPFYTATGSNIEWWSNSALTILLFTGNIYTPSIGTPGTYNYYVTQTITGCRSSSDTIQFTINYTPPPIANNVTVPFGSPVPDLTSTGTNVQWYDTSNTLVYSGGTFASGNTAIGSYTYYVSQTLNSCESLFDTVVLVILPGAPIGINESVCEGNPVPDLTASGNNLQWYSNPLLTLLAGTGSPFATGQTTAGTYTYYVTQTINSIESPSDTVTLVIYPIPAIPFSTNQTACAGSTIPNLTATGTNIQWYDTTMTLVFSGSPFNTGQTVAGTYIYIVTQSVNGCESPVDSVRLIIISLPPAPIACNDTSICYGDSVPALTASGTDIIWHDTTGAIVGNGSPFNTGITVSGTFIFYATQTDTLTSCESLGDTVVLSINSSLPPIVSDAASCFGMPVPPLTASGAIIQWYDTAGVLLFTGNSFNTGQTAVGTYTYYITETSIGTCESPNDTALLIISSPPTIAPTVQNESACFGTTIPDLVATTGTIINWYTDISLTNQVYSGNPFATGMTLAGTYIYFATDSTPGCPEGPSDTAILTINSIPVTLVVNDTSVCFGGAPPYLVATGINVQWYDTSMTLVYSGTTFNTGQTAIGNYTYLVTQSDLVSGCSSIPDSATLTIHSLPSKPIALDTVVCSASIIPNLTALGNNIHWLDTTNSFLYSGNSYATGMTSVGTYIYYVTQTDIITGCESQRDTSILSILFAPPVPVANDVAVCVGNPVPVFTATGTNIKWYSDASLINIVNFGNTFNTGITSIGSYTYYLTDSLSGCVSSNPDSATLFINPVPIQPTASNQTLCYGNTVILTTTGNNPQWYTDGTLINMIGTGNNFNLGIKPVGYYTYYVSDYAAGCGKSPADTVKLTINPNPLVTANMFSHSMLPGDSVVLVAYNALTYFWTPPIGLNTTTGSTVIASPNITTTYIVTGTNAYGCSSDTSIFILLNPIGINEAIISINDLKIYPNPASKHFTIEFSTNLLTPMNIYISNIIGEKVMTLDIKETTVQGLKKYKYEIDTQSFADGFYSIQIVNNLGSISRKIVLKK